jgi:hypothetical protein
MGTSESVIVSGFIPELGRIVDGRESTFALLNQS